MPVRLGGGKFFHLFRPVVGLCVLPGCGRLSLAPFFTPFFVLFFKLYLNSSNCNLFVMLKMAICHVLTGGINTSVGPVLALIRVLNTSAFFYNVLANAFFKFGLCNGSVPFFGGVHSLFFLSGR